MAGTCSLHSTAAEIYRPPTDTARDLQQFQHGGIPFCAQCGSKVTKLSHPAAKVEAQSTDSPHTRGLAPADLHIRRFLFFFFPQM